MPKRLLFFALLLVGALSFVVRAQEADSLLTLLPQQPDREKITTLMLLGKAYFIQGEDSLSKLYSQQSYRLAKKLGNARVEGLARLVWVRTEMVYNTSLEEAYAQLDTVDQLAARTKDQSLQGWAYFRRAQIYSGSYKHAKEVQPLFQKALAAFEQAKDPEGIGSVYVDLGGEASASGNYLVGINYFLKGKKILETLNRPVLLRAVTANLASAYQAIGKDAMAMKYCQESIALADKLHDPRLKAHVLGTLGDIYLDKNDYPRALSTYQRQEKALAPFEDQSHARAVARVGTALFKLQRYDQALRYCRRADSLYFHRSGYEEAIDYYIEGLYAEIYLAKQQYPQAVKHAQRGLTSLEEYGEYGRLHLDLASFHSYLAQAYEQLGNARQALFHFKNFKVHSDSLINNDALEKIANATMTYEFEKKEETNKLRIQTLENEKLRQSRTVLLLLLSGGLGIVGLIGWSNRRLKGKNRELLRKNKEIESALFRGQSLERKRVASELHDNLNTKVTALRWNIEALDRSTMTPQNVKIYQRIFDLSGDIYTDIRLISHSMLPAELEKNGLEAALRRLVTMLDHSQSNRTRFHLVAKLGGARFSEALEYQLYIITLELVNNIIKHAEASDAWITVTQDSQVLWLVVSDNGVGLPEETQKEGMGVHNLRARVEDLAGTLAIDSTPGQGTKVSVQVPTG
ncbi:hypothetical protein GCM10027275_29140 [Rhabdobacter roseus]|uniref:Oxygen sensor histidine kinase NreB n=1 Tax=Rhabdobacter roseus TaxID=1655419 RepID=A0A840TPP0_9BACT|nr:tetratricopeptide repeat-containing sensor histidine kinase [Rhabdobacter roseus]MBB5284865.1 signal transduction histidine kinase [Rhabdobacter roseus]